jgi:hypothetical protein
MSRAESLGSSPSPEWGYRLFGVQGVSRQPDEIFPTEPPGSYKHALATKCWCRPVMIENALTHRPWAECASEVATMLLRSDVFPMPWETQAREK